MGVGQFEQRILGIDEFVMVLHINEDGCRCAMQQRSGFVEEIIAQHYYYHYQCQIIEYKHFPFLKNSMCRFIPPMCTKQIPFSQQQQISIDTMSELKEGNLRLNVILKEKDQFKISLITHPKTTVARFKRNIEQQLQQLHGIAILVSVIENSEGFVLSNNSCIGEHVNSNDTLYVSTHKQKTGTNMNLPGNVTDLFMTLRYVCGSVLVKLQQLDVQLHPLEIVPQIIHLGFWYSNIEIVTALCKLLNKIFTLQTLEQFYRQAHEMQNISLLKLFSFWLVEVRNSFAIFPEVGEELLALLYKLSLNKEYAQLLRNHKMMKNVLELSKQGSLPPQMKRMAVQIMRNVAGKGGAINNNVNSAYIPTALQQSSFGSNLEEVLDLIASNSQEMKSQGLQQLIDNPKLISQATVRFDYYSKLTSIFTLKSIKDKQTARLFSQVIKTLTAQTTKQKAKQIMQKDIIRKIHNFLLQSHLDSHPSVFQYYSFIARESSSKGMFNVQQASQFLGSPYLDFLKINIEALCDMSDKDRKTSAIRFLPHVKDYIKLSLKTENEGLSTNMLKIISNLTLDQQCRYQIINLKGLQIFVKFLQIGQKNGNSELQRTCAKGLLNLSLSSRETKAKTLSLMSGILDRFYKGGIDSIAGSYIQNILKSANS